ncbi:MAG: hypothetical protein M0Z81_13605, partial [Deltaproteobacteria bacterium]|nr:hypothetical protein [Deltaproteobacteria bacterium]
LYSPEGYSMTSDHAGGVVARRDRLISPQPVPGSRPRRKLPAKCISGGNHGISLAARVPHNL